MLLYLIAIKPQILKKTFYFEVYNEASLLMISYFLIPFSFNIITPELKYDLGWCIVALISINILANEANLICTVIWHLY